MFWNHVLKEPFKKENKIGPTIDTCGPPDIIRVKDDQKSFEANQWQTDPSIPTTC